MITIDCETRSEANLKKVGAWAYSEHPSTETICVCYGIDDCPVQAWWPHGAGGMPERAGSHAYLGAPADLIAALEAGHEVEAHHVAFEISIWTNVLAKRYNWPPLPPLRQWRDTMAVACYYAMPASLDKLSRALGFGPKDPRGDRLITKYSKLHLKTAKRVIPDDDFAEWIEYCKDDVRREQSVSDELGDLPEPELEAFLIDLETNLRGMYLDLEGIAAATAVVEERAGELTEEFRALTGVNPTQRGKVMEWCEERHVTLENLKAEYLDDLLEGDELGQGEVRRALEIRREVSKASTKKLDAMARQVGADGRARFQTRYHGAFTGRNTGSGFQPLNLKRSFEDVEPEQLVRDIVEYRDPRWLDTLYGDAMDAVSRASRHWIMAEPGNKIIAADYSSVEAIVLVCLAGEEWKVDAFRKGEPIYELGACSIYNWPLERAYDPDFKKKWPDERQDGKVRELACGYQGALGAWLKFDSSGRHSDEKIIEMVRGWRDDHPAVTQYWHDLEDAAIRAVADPGSAQKVSARGWGVFECVDQWLTLVLPDGKRIWYRDPQLRAVMPQWHRPAEKEDCAAGTCGCYPRTQVSYKAQKNGQWKRVHTYGGKLAENITQATARQILAPAQKRARAAGYNLVLTVYDELVCEVAEDFGSGEELTAIMSECPGSWAEGWPISVKPWEGKRYRK